MGQKVAPVSALFHMFADSLKVCVEQYRAGDPHTITLPLLLSVMNKYALKAGIELELGSTVDVLVHRFADTIDAKHNEYAAVDKKFARLQLLTNAIVNYARNCGVELVPGRQLGDIVDGRLNFGKP